MLIRHAGRVVCKAARSASVVGRTKGAPPPRSVTTTGFFLTSPAGEVPPARPKWAHKRAHSGPRATPSRDPGRLRRLRRRRPIRSTCFQACRSACRTTQAPRIPPCARPRWVVRRPAATFPTRWARVRSCNKPRTDGTTPGTMRHTSVRMIRPSGTFRATMRRMATVAGVPTGSRTQSLRCPSTARPPSSGRPQWRARIVVKDPLPAPLPLHLFEAAGASSHHRPTPAPTTPSINYRLVGRLAGRQRGRRPWGHVAATGQEAQQRGCNEHLGAHTLSRAGEE